ncbi:MAG: hypothetical protein HOK21_15675 [Rhodospirillaceae bacterium]|jgi:hypothetical protein|nr:hypothetical protein [Rhodospirillaceae bacterium]MBT4042779.1 hypothetical protein [Rhodospirillaceae bacterium]MBT4688748.1 hypothetical protein [Rhodospirillaceae bacterium]MBT5083426.1 hypothetical protein [Rhodospirillaceae bacterium]MBT5525524.1 hypothetical protein [Rhodospirillaceae bacterium]
MLSLPKILLFLAVVVVVVLVSKSFRGRGQGAKSGAKSVGDDEEETDKLALDLNECAVCGNFVAADSRGCDRADCPHAN